MKNTEISWDDIDKKKMMGYGTLFLFGTRTLVYPAQVIKTKIQFSNNSSSNQMGSVSNINNNNKSNNNNNNNQSAYKTFRHIVHNDGPIGLYKGFFVMAFSLLPAQALYYSSYEFIKSKVAQTCQRWQEREQQMSKSIITLSLTSKSNSSPYFWQKKPVTSAADASSNMSTPIIHGEGAILVEGANGNASVALVSDAASLYRDLISNLVAGSVSSLISQIVVVPVDVIQQRMIVDDGDGKTGAWKSIRETVQKEGFRGFYRGSSISAVTYASGSGIWWLTYSLTKQQMDYVPFVSSNNQIVALQALSGCMASMTAVTLTHPLDVIKTRIQTCKKIHAPVDAGKITISAAYKSFVAKEGYFALFRKGLTARLLSSVPVSVLMILSYEAAKRWSLKNTLNH